MRSCISINASFFNSQRMVLQYVAEAYRNGHAAKDTASRGGP